MSVMATTSPLLVFAALLGACVWVGGFVAIVVVTRVARRTLEPRAQVAFFRALGRSYGLVSGSALAVALIGGAALLSDERWTGTTLATVVVAGALLVATAAGVIQARGMTRLRQRAIDEPNDPALAARVRRGAVCAGALRATIGILSVGLLALAAVLAT